MALEDQIPEILKHIDNHFDYMDFNLRIYEMLEGQIKDEVEKSLRREVLSPSAFSRIKERIPPINVLRKTTDKLSKVYVETPNRITDKETDQSIMDAIVRESSIDNVLIDANRFLNAQNMFAVEPFVERGKHKFRALAGHQFLVFSDDPVDPTRPTVFIKFLGKEAEDDFARWDRDGNKIEETQSREVHTYALFSDDEFLVIDNAGTVRMDKMSELGATSSKNPFGRIPYIYGRNTRLELLPFQNQEGFDISILVPKLLADLNYAAQFMSHSIIWSKNTDLDGQELNPDAIVHLGDSHEDGDPELGVIKPEVDIDKILELVNYQMSNYFASKGIKVGSNDVMANGRDSSALGKAMDEADTTQARKEQTEFFREVEKQLWDLMVDVQATWSRMGLVDESRTFSKTFIETFQIQFSEIRPVKTFNQKIQEVRELRAELLMSRKQALRTLYPDLNDKQIDEWVSELDDEAQELADKMMEQGGGLDGKFGEGNAVAGNQTETSKNESDQDERTSPNKPKDTSSN